MPSNNTTTLVIETLTKHLKETRAAYYANMPGVTYDDMKAAAARLLTMRGAIEQATGRKVVSKPTTGQIAALLRGNL